MAQPRGFADLEPLVWGIMKDAPSLSFPIREHLTHIRQPPKQSREKTWFHENKHPSKRILNNGSLWLQINFA